MSLSVCPFIPASTGHPSLPHPLAAVLPAVCYGSMCPRKRGVLGKPGKTLEICIGEHTLPPRKLLVTQEESPAGGRKALPSCSPLPCRVTPHSFPVDSACFRGCPGRHSPGTAGPARVPTLTALLSPGPLPSFLRFLGQPQATLSFRFDPRAGGKGMTPGDWCNFFCGFSWKGH